MVLPQAALPRRAGHPPRRVRGLRRRVRPGRRRDRRRLRGQHGQGLGRRHRQSRSDAPRPRGVRVQRRVQPRRPARRFGRRRPNRAALGPVHRARGVSTGPATSATTRARPTPWPSAPTAGRLVAGGEDGFATIWDATDGRAVRRLPEKHENTAVCVAFSPDGALAGDRELGRRAADLGCRAPGQLLRKIPAHDHRLSAVVFSPDGRRVATASFDRTVKVWERSSTGELLQTPARPHRLDFRPGIQPRRPAPLLQRRRRQDGQGLGPADRRGGSQPPRPHALLPRPGRQPRRRAPRLGRQGRDDPHLGRHAPDGGEGLAMRHLRARSRGVERGVQPRRPLPRVGQLGRKQRAASGTRTACACCDTFTPPPNIMNIFHVGFSPDGKRIATAAASRDREAVVNVWETATGGGRRRDPREGSMPFFVTFDPTGRLPGPGGTGAHRAGPRRPDRQSRRASSGGTTLQIWGMAFSPDGPDWRRRATTAPSASGRGTRAHLGPEQEPQLMPDVRVDGYGNRVAFSPDGHYLATGGEGFAVKIWDARDATRRAAHPHRPHRRRLRRGLQPRRPLARDRRRGHHREDLGRGDLEAAPHPARPHRPGHEPGVQPRQPNASPPAAATTR